MTCMCSRCRNQGGWFAVRRRRQGMVLAGFVITLFTPYPLCFLPPVSPTPIVAPVDVNPLNRPEQVAPGEGQEQQVCVCV